MKRYSHKVVYKNARGRVERVTDMMFGGNEYIVIDAQGDCKARIPSYQVLGRKLVDVLDEYL